MALISPSISKFSSKSRRPFSGCNQLSSCEERDPCDVNDLQKANEIKLDQLGNVTTKKKKLALRS